MVRIEKEGYEPVEVNVTPQISDAGSAGMAGNVLVGGLIDVAVDGSSSAMKDLTPNPIKVNLVKLGEKEKDSEPVSMDTGESKDEADPEQVDVEPPPEDEAIDEAIDESIDESESDIVSEPEDSE